MAHDTILDPKSGHDQRGNWVMASMNYLADLSVKPIVYNPPPGTAAAPRRLGNYQYFDMRVHDARPRAESLSLDREGFCLTRHDTKVSNFLDEEEVRRVYYPEMDALVKQVTGASRVAIFDHTLRHADKPQQRGLRAPVQNVHNDYTEKSGPQRVKELLGEDEAAPLLKRRFAEYNVWRPIAGPVKSWPLALVDASTITPRDLAACELVYLDRTGEIYIGVYNPAHAWFYVPEMAREEAILIKCYDSATDGRARFSLHSAFADPTSPPDAPPRQSIEIRAFAFF
ncbi:MAG TPA: CmcJ/NvfI family oxidoreductase [Stellaceae bacterium]|jgi:hypothetical protein|nr:CmcJ/NvfI family oxidoreductase [Stellaceae bacterium]